MKKQKEEHPSFGMISFSRAQVSDGGVPLYGSSIKHSNIISLEIKHSSNDRHLCKNWYHEEDPIVTVWMSQSQFVEAITTMNTTGVPCTIERLGVEIVPKYEFENVRERLVDEFVDNTKEILEKSLKMLDAVTELSAKSTLTKADRKTISDLSKSIHQDIASNLGFVAKQFNRQMESSVKEAKGEVEAFFEHKIRALGSEKLTEELENGLLRNIIQIEE